MIDLRERSGTGAEQRKVPRHLFRVAVNLDTPPQLIGEHRLQTRLELFPTKTAGQRQDDTEQKHDSQPHPESSSLGQHQQCQRDQHPRRRYQGAAATRGNDRRRGHDNRAGQQYHVRPAAHPRARPRPFAVGASQRPPISQTNRPNQIEVLRRIRAVGVGTKLSVGRFIENGLQQPKQF